MIILCGSYLFLNLEKTNSQTSPEGMNVFTLILGFNNQWSVDKYLWYLLFEKVEYFYSWSIDGGYMS